MDKKITIGLFVDSFFPMMDGVCMVVDNYAKRLIKYANVIVFAPDSSGGKYDDSKLSYKVVRCRSIKFHFSAYKMPLPNVDRKFIKELEKYNLDIVHIHSPFMIGEKGVEYAKKHGIPSIGTMHTQFKKDIKKALKNDKITEIVNKKTIDVFNKCDECWAVNSEVAKIFYEEYGYKEMPKVMNNATEMMPVKDKDEARSFINKKYNIDEDEKVFLFVGRINSLKNIFFIAESLRILKEKNPNFKFKMLFVGAGLDEEELRETIKRNNMENEIIMCGQITDREELAKYYVRADLFLFPSLYDASSIVQIEAASQCTPCLFLEGAATTATIDPNRNGYISKNDVNEYADNIIKIIKDEQQYKEVSENCFKEIYKNWDDTIEEVYNKYLDIINKK